MTPHPPSPIRPSEENLVLMQLQASSLAMDTGGEAPNTYTTISSDHYCGSVWGNYPMRCVTYHTPSQCQSLCDGFSFCEAYSSGIWGQNVCALMTNTGKCPIGDQLFGDVTFAINHLKPGFETGYNCMFKNPPTPTPTASPTPYPTTPTPTTSPTSSPTASPTQVPNQCANI